MKRVLKMGCLSVLIAFVVILICATGVKSVFVILLVFLFIRLIMKFLFALFCFFLQGTIFFVLLSFFYLKLKPIEYENKEIENRKDRTGNTGKS